jgi:hypothetical protein
MMSIQGHPYSEHSGVYNFLFHPLHGEGKLKTALSVITNIFLTIITGALWQIPFWIVNRLDNGRVEIWNQRQTPDVNKASSTIFPSGGSAVAGSGESAAAEGVSRGNPSDVPKIAFGKVQWEKYFGDVGSVPDLPADINEILAADCQLFPEKKVWETHMLVLIPETVDNKPLTLTSLGELVKKPKDTSGCPSEYGTFSEDVTDECKTQSIQSHWVLVTKDVIKGSRNQPYARQKQMVAEIASRTGIPYEVPSARDMAVCLFMHHVTSGKHFFSNTPWTCTRCRDEDIDGDPVTVGGSNKAKSVAVASAAFDCCDEDDGVAASWNL